MLSQKHYPGRAAGGRPKFWADKPAGRVVARAVFGGWSSSEDWLGFAEGIRHRADLSRDHWTQNPEC
jgi:hypothetical protein